MTYGPEDRPSLTGMKILAPDHLQVILVGDEDSNTLEAIALAIGPPGRLHAGQAPMLGFMLTSKKQVQELIDDLAEYRDRIWP